MSPAPAVAPVRPASSPGPLVRRALAALVVLLAACGGGSDSPTQPSGGGELTMSAVAGGELPTVVAGTPVPVAPAVIVKDANGNPKRGVAVTFAVTSGGGQVTGASATTGTDGIARAGSWTLGSAAGANALTASATGVAPVQFTATARLPHWTVMVYLAADNNLALSGVQDLDEMEAAGFDPDVRVVVQAEFSAQYLAQAGCRSAMCINRPNYNTFRYSPTGAGDTRPGPDGAAIDIGNVNMIDPATLAGFVTWGKQTYPAEHYAVVLWNHGGGYTGLIEDVTSGGANLMSLAALNTALTNAGHVDLIDFDMCLMGGYETLELLKDKADYAVFSEEVVPGAGNPYTDILNAMQANANASPRQVAQTFVDRFDASFTDGRSSTTKSAYELAEYAAFDQALGNLATSLAGNVATYGPAVDQAGRASQKYEYTELTDLANFLDSLKPRVADATVRAQIDALRAQAMLPAFRVASRARSGTGNDSRNVSRSTGMHILLPTSLQSDQLNANGPRSLAAYQQLFPNKAWTAFLTAFLSANVPTNAFDQGEQRFEAFLIWDSAAVSRNADVDLFVLEPDGRLYVPYVGTVTPNGHLTNDSYDDHTFYEGYLTNRYVLPGTYTIIGSLYADPQDFQPRVDILYRYAQTADFTSLYQPNFPRLSKAHSIDADATPTWDEIYADAYSDFRILATAPLGTPQLASARGFDAAIATTPSGGAALQAIARPPVGLTTAQLRTVRALVKARHDARAGLRAPAAVRRGLR